MLRFMCSLNVILILFSKGPKVSNDELVIPMRHLPRPKTLSSRSDEHTVSSILL